MALPYPITSYASRHVDLTGGLLTSFEDKIINFFTKWQERRRIASELQIMSDRELADLGLNRSDIGIVADGTYKAGAYKRKRIA